MVLGETREGLGRHTVLTTSRPCAGISFPLANRITPTHISDVSEARTTEGSGTTSTEPTPEVTTSQPARPPDWRVPFTRPGEIDVVEFQGRPGRTIQLQLEDGVALPQQPAAHVEGGALLLLTDRDRGAYTAKQDAAEATAQLTIGCREPMVEPNGEGIARDVDGLAKPDGRPRLHFNVEIRGRGSRQHNAVESALETNVRGDHAGVIDCEADQEANGLAAKRLPFGQDDVGLGEDPAASGVVGNRKATVPSSLISARWFGRR